MKIFKKIGHWILFIIGGFLGTHIVLLIATLLPFFVGVWLFDFGDFWFLFLGSIAISIYYFLVYAGVGYFFIFLNRKKPDYWVSSIFLGLVTLHFFYWLITNLGITFTEYKELFLSFKGICLLITILPAYLQILFSALILQFIKSEDWE
jgi:hypothetical protein